jgi:UDP-glucuronate 4-epimerase
MASYMVTGAAGFIGARVTDTLLAEGHSVVGVDNLNDAYDVRLKEWRLAQLQARPGFRFYKLDICQRAELAETVFGRHEFEAVINLAARAGVRYSVEDPWAYYETNLTGTLNLLELCRSHGIGKFVLSSSSSVYGQGNPLPYREDQPTDQPLSPYAASKKAAETLCYTYHYLHGLDVTVFRYFTVYGPAGRPDMSPFRFVQRISEGRPIQVYGDGRQSRDFTYVDDIAHGTVAGLRPLGYEIINLGSDRPVVLSDMIGRIEELTGKRAYVEHRPAHAADATATWANIGKAAERLGWRPQVRFGEGLANLVGWYRANRDWAREVCTD